MLNHILEIANNVTTINRLALVIYLSKYIFDEYRRNPEYFKRYIREFLAGFFTGEAKPMRQQPRNFSEIVLVDVKRHAMCLSFALIVDKAGALIIGITVLIWRASGVGGGPGPLNFAKVGWMVTGSIGMAIGTLLILRILSIARFGGKIWLPLLAIDVLYVLTAFI